MRWNNSYFQELGKSAPVVNDLRDVGEQVADVVRATAPVDSAEYVNNVRVETFETPFRTGVRVVADVEHAMVVESKNGTMARALRAVNGG